MSGIQLLLAEHDVIVRTLDAHTGPGCPPVTLEAAPHMKYVVAPSNQASEPIVVHRVGDDLWIGADDAQPDFVIEHYYSSVGDVMLEDANGSYRAYADIATLGDGDSATLGISPLAGTDRLADAATPAAATGHAAFLGTHSGMLMGAAGMVAGGAIGAVLTHLTSNSDASHAEALPATHPGDSSDAGQAATGDPMVAGIYAHPDADRTLVPHDDTTDDARPLISGTATPGQIVFIHDEAQTLLGSTVANEGGTWLFQPDAALAPGQHVFSAISQGPHGDWHGPGNAYPVQIAAGAAAPGDTAPDGTVPDAPQLADLLHPAAPDWFSEPSVASPHLAASQADATSSAPVDTPALPIADTGWHVPVSPALEPFAHESWIPPTH